MSSDYTGDPTLATDTLSLMTDDDEPSAQVFRVPLERLLDNDAAANLAANTAALLPATRFTLMHHIDASTITDTALFMGVTLADPADPTSDVWLIKDQDDDLFLVHSESDVWLEQDAAAMASITADVREAASNGSIVVIIGTGGNRNAYHTGSGDWQAGGTTGGALQFLAYSPPNALPDGGDLFYAGGNGNGSVNSSPDAATNWTVTATGFSDVRGIAILGAAGGSSAGYAVVLGQSGVQPRFALSVSGGNSVWSGTQQPPDAATAESPGTLCGAPQSPNSAVYHAMHCNGGARIRTAYAEDGFTWQSGTTIEAPAGLSFSATPRMIQCQTTGLFVLLAPVTVTQLVLYVSRDFVTWSDPRLLTAVTTAFGVAGGRIFYTTGGVSRIFASEAIGVVA